MTTNQPALTERQIDDIDKRALELVAIAHGDGDDRDVARLTAGLDRAGLIGLAISCAAMVDHNRTMSDLLAWLPTAPDPHHGWTEQQRRAANNAHQRLRHQIHSQERRPA
ncbi:hypothetical protein [Rhodococcus rhodochrous]|uniref:hypothetical protein n=1 Tax=Rhodococcus rhodochrous TaxID=1829 RepID=UPI00177EE72F|nr:hypothetical protein [Rhodococcus rhodochrous]QOH55235.1 hypothetical protein C6Y44_04055 [Rhodococcus rhodochrous]